MATASATRSSKARNITKSAAPSNLGAELEGRNHGKAVRKALDTGVDTVCDSVVAAKSYLSGLWTGFTK